MDSCVQALAAHLPAPLFFVLPFLLHPDFQASRGPGRGRRGQGGRVRWQGPAHRCVAADGHVRPPPVSGVRAVVLHHSLFLLSAALLAASCTLQGAQLQHFNGALRRLWHPAGHRRRDGAGAARLQPGYAVPHFSQLRPLWPSRRPHLLPLDDERFPRSPFLSFPPTLPPAVQPAPGATATRSTSTHCTGALQRPRFTT